MQNLKNMQALMKYAESQQSVVCKHLIAALSENVGITLAGAKTSCKLSQLPVNIQHVEALSDKTSMFTVSVHNY